MRRSPLGLVEVVERSNLEWAFHRAARSARHSAESERFARNLDAELFRMRAELLAGSFAFGHFHRFEIRDPKPRVIHAPLFRERVGHHALMSVVGPVLDRGLIDDTFACRTGRGTHAVVRRAQHRLRRYDWYVQFDVARYFDRLDHARLVASLGRRLKSRELLETCEQLIRAYPTQPGKGLPIGALSSQHFTNFYLDGLDRFILEQCGTRACVRYMDDVVFFCDSASHAKETLAAARAFADEHLGLTLKEPSAIARSERGLTFCGFRILRGQLRLSRRRQRRYIRGRARWEAAYVNRWIDATALQRGYDGMLATTAHADARAWRREQLARSPGVGEEA